MKIQFREALTVKHPKTVALNAGAAILTLFSEPSADSRALDTRTLLLFLKTSADFRFPNPHTIRPTHFAAVSSIQPDPATFSTKTILPGCS